MQMCTHRWNWETHKPACISEADDSEDNEETGRPVGSRMTGGKKAVALCWRV